MDARTAIDKAITELSRNRSDRAQVWALIAIAEATQARNTLQDALQATYRPAQPEAVPQDQPGPERPTGTPTELIMWNPPPLTRPTPHAHPERLHVTTPKANLGNPT